jgi:hypothetical protein
MLKSDQRSSKGSSRSRRLPVLRDVAGVVGWRQLCRDENGDAGDYQNYEAD